MSTGPLVPAGVVTTIAVAEFEVIVAGTPPKETDVAFPKFVPVIVTASPPVVGPALGVIELIEG
jgi:hypothetical protein